MFFIPVRGPNSTFLGSQQSSSLPYVSREERTQAQTPARACLCLLPPYSPVLAVLVSTLANVHPWTSFHRWIRSRDRTMQSVARGPVQRVLVDALDATRSYHPTRTAKTRPPTSCNTAQPGLRSTHNSKPTLPRPIRKTCCLSRPAEPKRAF